MAKAKRTIEERAEEHMQKARRLTALGYTLEAARALRAGDDQEADSWLSKAADALKPTE